MSLATVQYNPHIHRRLHESIATQHIRDVEEQDDSLDCLLVFGCAIELCSSVNKILAFDYVQLAHVALFTRPS